MTAVQKTSGGLGCLGWTNGSCKCFLIQKAISGLAAISDFTGCIGNKAIVLKLRCPCEG